MRKNPGAHSGIQLHMEPPDDMELPHANPVGIAVTPEGFSQRPRCYGSAVRIAAGLLLGTFLAVVCVTTAVSLGKYCLTTDAENTTSLPPAYLPGTR